MKIEINGVELDTKRTLRTDMVYEDLFNESIDANNIKSKTVINIFIASVIAAQQRQGVSQMTKEEVMNWIEEDPLREMYVGTVGKEWADDYIKYLLLVQDYYKNKEKKKGKKKNESIEIETVDDIKKN